jgi:DeoR family transcriptional regulator, suf operon transcriptional repressor
VTPDTAAVTEDAEPSGPDAPESPLQQLPTTRRAILNLLKRQGPLDASAVATALSLTPAAIRLQLAHLEEDGLLAHHDAVPEGAGRGRPRHVYGLTSAAEALYPKRYGDLTTELLGYLGGPGASQVDELFEQRRRRRVAGALPRTADRPFDEQVAALTAILDEDGYLAEAERLEDGSWRITEHNCAILTVAHGFSQACTSELAFIRDALPGATVRRVAHLMDGAHVCAYVVSPPGSSSPPL